MIQEKKRNQSLQIGNLTAKIPVIQGGMGVGISLSGLAGSVAASGGVGVISSAQIGYRDPEWEQHPVETNLKVLKEEIRKAKEIARGGIVGVNIMVASRYYEKYVQTAAEAGADLIISGAGLPVDLPGLVKEKPVKIAPVISSLKSLEVITKYWSRKYGKVPDLVIVEGPLAGGHLGFKKDELDDIEGLHYNEEVKRILEKVRSLEKDTRIPVAVAGGIYTPEDGLPYLKMGADALQIATRFVTTYECDADIRYKEAYLQAKKEDITIVKSPVGMPGRAIYNSFLKKAGRGRIPAERCHACLAVCRPAEIPYCITDALVQAAKGNVEDGLLFCGANAYRADHLEHVSDIMKEFEEKLVWQQE
jgi:NAD(P)H-dependent flavin oxidoreductase YrpB (nitropropane dioxygenase family)